jgi:hypothetical protein
MYKVIGMNNTDGSIDFYGTNTFLIRGQIWMISILLSKNKSFHIFYRVKRRLKGLGSFICNNLFIFQKLNFRKID